MPKSLGVSRSEKYQISVAEMAKIVVPPGEIGYLAVIRGYFDESYKDRRVYAIGGYVGRDRYWQAVSKRWKRRRLEDGVRCFHATDCENGLGEFEGRTSEQRTQLKRDLIQIVSDEKMIEGFGSAVIIEDFNKVRGSSERAKRVLGSSPYFLCFQMIIGDVCEALEKGGANPGIRVAYIFEEQEEYSGRAKRLYDQFRRTNLTYAPRMGSLTYASKGAFIPLEIADKLAYETMKEILNNKYDRTRPRRKSMERMLPRIRSISLLTEPQLEKLVRDGRIASDLGVK
jgi:hypothetical protein